MKIVQFTDIHIGAKGENTRNVDIRENLKSVLKSIAGEEADMVVLTGDLCFNEPRRNTYKWIKKQLNKRGIDPFVIPGNHDDSVMLAHHFDMPLIDSEVYFKHEVNGTCILFLDTAIGKMSPAQWAWLENHVHSAHKLVIFMHHPPVHANVPFMDGTHAFEEQEKFQELLAQRQDTVEIFCGHYHVDKSISLRNLHVHITPSCFFQIRDDIKDFGVDHYRIGYRVIEMSNELISHSVRYL